MARTLIASDNFNRASLGADWEQLNPFGGTLGILGSTHIETVDEGVARWVGAGAFTDDQYASLKLTSVPDGGQNALHGVILRASADTDAARDYYAVIVNDDDVLRIDKTINGTVTTLASLSATQFNAGTRIEGEVTGQSPNITIKALKDGVVLLTVTGQTDLGTGKPGILAWTVTTPVWQSDDWEAGNLTADAVAEGRILIPPYRPA